jgi:hypothetical protein
MSRQRLLAMLSASACLLAHTQPSVALQANDGPQGMTCQYVSAAARVAWERPGGDWVDKLGQRHGDEPYARASLARQKLPQSVGWDVSSLVAEVSVSGQSEIAIYLQSLPGGTGSGGADFFSREHEVVQDHPVLIVQWNDDATTRHRATADAHFSCPNHRAYGSQPVIQVGGKRTAFITFEVPLRPGHTLRNAELRMISSRQTGSGATVGVFRGLLPGGETGRVERGIAASFANDVGLESHPAVWVVDRFDDMALTRAWLNDKDLPRVRQVTRDPANRFEAFQGPALAVTLEAGATQAMNSHIRPGRMGAPEPEEAYFRYYLRLGENWNPTRDGGKLPGLSGTYGRGGWGSRKSNGKNGWSARGSFLQATESVAGSNDRRAIGTYIYHAGMAGTYGDTWGWNLGPTGVLEKNRWYSIEQRVRLNTPGRADGVYEAWVDGSLAFTRSDIRYRDTDALKIESVWMNVYHGGSRPAPHEMGLYIDNLVVARTYIGPAGGQRP